MSTLHTVKHGETFSSIARKYGCTVQSLKRANHIAGHHKIKEGSSLAIPDVRQRDETARPVTTKAAVQPDPAQKSDYWYSGGTAWVKETWHKAEAGAEQTWTSSKQWTQDKLHEVEDEASHVWVKSMRIGHGLYESLTGWYRDIESFDFIHKKDQAKTQPQTEPKKKDEKKSAADKKTATAGRKHRDEVLQVLHDRLCATPHVVATSGVMLTRNERKMIVAAVGLCEIGNDVFGSENKDQEFVGRKFGKRGIETGYSRIVHIGLSYGYIQYTQDGGSLGVLLKRMREKVGKKTFEEYFPNGGQLIELTTDGLSDKQSTRGGKSGQAYFRGLSKDERNKLRSRVNTDDDKDGKPDEPLRSDEEIRGARVQKIAYAPGYSAIDLWEDYEKSLPPPYSFSGYASAFKAAGDVPAFQDAQLELAVENYFNPVLTHCQEWNIRSAIGLAFVLACAVRGGPVSGLSRLLSRVGAEKFKLKGRFESAEQERSSVKAIAEAAGTQSTGKNGKTRTSYQIGDVNFDADERRRAGLLMRDEFHFLTEDLYDLQTYDLANDK